MVVILKPILAPQRRAGLACGIAPTVEALVAQHVTTRQSRLKRPGKTHSSAAVIVT